MFIQKYVLILMGLFQITAFADAHTCSQNGKIEGTLCQVGDLINSSDPNRLVIQFSMDAGPFSRKKHLFSKFIGGAKVDSGICVGTLATGTLLLGPAKCTSDLETLTVGVSPENNPDFAPATLRNNRTGDLENLKCENTCVLPTDF